MKKWYLLLLLSVFFIGCNDDEVTQEPTSEEVSNEMKAIADKASGDIVTLVESEGVKGAVRLIELLNGFDFATTNASKTDIKAKIDLISHYFINGVAGRVGEDVPTTFDEIKGLYEWNAVLGTFDKTASDFFIVRFPTEGSEVNNAELKISQLEFVTIIEDNGDFIEEYELPAVIVGYLKVDEAVVIELDFMVNWSSVGFPEEAQIDLFVDPFTFMIGFNDSFELKSSLVSSIKIGDEILAGIEVDVEWLSAEKEEPKLIEGQVQYFNLKIVGSVDTTFDGESFDINDYVNLDLLLDDQKVGEIVFEEDLAYVQYNDGTKELLEEIIQPIMSQIESLLLEFQ